VIFICTFILYYLRRKKRDLLTKALKEALHLNERMESVEIFKDMRNLHAAYRKMVSEYKTLGERFRKLLVKPIKYNPNQKQPPVDLNQSIIEASDSYSEYNQLELPEQIVYCKDNGVNKDTKDTKNINYISRNEVFKLIDLLSLKQQSEFQRIKNDLASLKHKTGFKNTSVDAEPSLFTLRLQKLFYYLYMQLLIPKLIYLIIFNILLFLFYILKLHVIQYEALKFQQ